MAHVLGAREKNGKKNGRREYPFGGEGTEVVDRARFKKASCGHWGGVATTMSEKARVSMRIPVNEFELFYPGDPFGGARLQNVVELPAPLARVANPAKQ